MRKFLFLILVPILCASKGYAQDNLVRDSVYTIVDTMPQFHGDAKDYIKKNLRYPKSDISEGIQGTVFVSFVVTKTGNITNVNIAKGIDSGLNAEAKELVMNMPAWIPGKKKGVAVNVALYIPVVFQLTNDYIPIVDTLKPNFYPKKGIYAHPFFSFGIGGISNIKQSPTTTYFGNNFTLAGGANIGYMFNEHMGLFGGLQIESYNETQNNSVLRSLEFYYTGIAGYVTQVKYTFSYCDIPVSFTYISSTKEHAGFYLDAGPVAEILTNTNESGSIQQLEATNGVITGGLDGTPNPIANKAAKVCYGAILNTGVFYPISNVFSLTANASTIIQLTSVGDGGGDIVNFTNGSSYNYFTGNYGKATSLLLSLSLWVHFSTR